MRRLVTEFGIGTSLRRADHTEAACRAVRDALWRNSIDVAGMLGVERDAMRVLVEIGVPDPDAVDAAKVAALLPYGEARVEVRRGGLAVPRPGGGLPTVVANAALSVSVEGV